MKCTKPNCNSGLPAKWQPVLLMWPEGMKPMECQPVSVNVNHHYLCDECQKNTIPSGLISRDDFKSIQDAVVHHGKQRPALSTAKFTFFVPETHASGGDIIL
jgi:hypothetical protein